MKCFRGWGVIVLSALGACQPHSVRAVETQTRVSPDQAPVVLEQLIPAPGVVFLVQIRAARLLAHQITTSSWESVLSSSRLAAYKRTTGLALDAIDELWIVGYPLGTLVLFDAHSCGPQVERAFVDQASSVAEQRDETHGSTFITGVISGEPQALYHRHGDFVAIAHGDIALAKIVRGYAEGQLTAKSALQTQFLAPLARLSPSALVRVFLVGPFEHATDAVAHGFAAGFVGIAPLDHELNLSVVARGLWGEQASSPLSTWLHSFLNTREARAVGLGFPLARPDVACAPERPASKPEGMALTQCQTSLRYDSAALAQAVYRITQAPGEELLAEDAPRGWRSLLLGEPEQPATDP